MELSDFICSPKKCSFTDPEFFKKSFLSLLMLATHPEAEVIEIWSWE